MPHLFRGIDISLSNEDWNIQATKIINRYLYYSTAELQAYGLSGQSFIDFYPVTTTKEGSKFYKVTPWGERIPVNSNTSMFQQETAARGIVTVIDTDKYKGFKRYKSNKPVSMMSKMLFESEARGGYYP